MLLQQKDTVSALVIFETLSEKNSNDWLILANIYLAKGKNKKAENAINNLPTTPEWKKTKTTLKAKIAFSNGKYNQAYSIMKDQNDKSFNGQYNTALAAFNAQEYEKAISIGKKLLPKASGQDKIDIYRLIGNSAIKSKNWESADSYFLKLTEIKPKDAVAWYNMAVAAYNLDRVDDSWDFYQKARKIDIKIKNNDIENRYKAFHTKPKDKIVIATLDKWYNQAVELQQKGKYKEAKKIYKKITGKDPNHYRAWNNLGTIHSSRNNFEKAIECHKTAIACKEDVIDGYANLVIIYIAMEDLEQAKEWLNKGKEQDPESEILMQVEVEFNKAEK